MLLMLALTLAACTDIAATNPAVCILDAPVLSPASAAAGDTVVLASSPLTEVWDTAVVVGGVRAELVSVDRADCDAWDACVAAEACTVCDTCNSCAESRAACVETAAFIVPAVAEGARGVEILNRHGRSPAVALEVLPSAVDTGGADTGAGDTAGGDTGAR